MKSRDMLNMMHILYFKLFSFYSILFGKSVEHYYIVELNSLNDQYDYFTRKFLCFILILI